MKEILVPCDFSKPSANAFRLALDIAVKSGSNIHLLNIIELPVLHDSVIMPVLNFEQEFLNELKEKAESSMITFVDKYDTEGVNITREALFGRVYSTLTKYILDKGIDLVVMGSHGVHGAREFFIGSNAEKIVRLAPVPVFVVKEYIKSPMKHIVFPNTLDTEHQEELTMKVKELQDLFKAKLHVVWINTPLNFTSDIITLKRMEAFAKRYMLKNYDLHIFNSRDEEEGILQFTNLIQGDLIAMGTHGQRGISHLVNGSLAEDVVNHTRGLVWTYTLKNELVEA